MIGCVISGELGKELEKVFRYMYAGDCKYSNVVFRLTVIFDRLANEGIITNGTRKRLETLLVQALAVNSFVIESRNSAEIAMVNTDTYAKEFLNLSEYMGWIIAELLHDPLLCNPLNERTDYEGIIAAFDECGRYARKSKQRKNAIKIIKHSIDYLVLDETVVYTVKSEKGIVMSSAPYEKEMSHVIFELKDGELDMSDLLDGRIHPLAYSVIAVNLLYNRFVIIDILNGKKIMHEGKISHVFYGRALFFVNGQRLGVIDRSTYRKRIISASAEAVCDDRNGLYWNLLNESGQTVSTHYYDLRTGRSKLKSCKKAVWHDFMHLLYDINLKYWNSVSSRLICYELFENVPVPFTVGNIMKKLAAIERHGYNGTVVHSEEYLDGINYLLSLDDAGDKNILIADKLSAYIETVNMTEDGYQAASSVRENVDYYSKICEQLDIGLLDSEDESGRDIEANDEGGLFDEDDEDDDPDEPIDSIISILDTEIAKVQMGKKWDYNKQLMDYIKIGMPFPCQAKKTDTDDGDEL